jgi:hypothetical protein
MTARLMVIAVATLSLSAFAGAAAPNAVPADTNRAPSRPADLVLASAEAVHAPDQVQAQPQAAPVKRVRVARVTTCRCGDPAAPTSEE